MKYCVDRIEGEIAILENLDTKELIEISLNELPKNTKENSILKLVDNLYELDIVEEGKRRENIQSKFDRLKKKKVNN